MFCHIIETSEASDLQHLRSLVDTFESTSASSSYNTCNKQYRLFKALYDVASKYIEVRARADGGQGDLSWLKTRQQYAQIGTETATKSVAVDALRSEEPIANLGSTNTIDAPSHLEPHSGPSFPELRLAEGSVELTTFGDIDMDMDLSGAELWDWFNENQSIMRMLEDP